MNEQRETYRLIGDDDSNSQINLILQRISDRLDRIEGLRGVPKFYSNNFDFSDNISGVFKGTGKNAAFSELSDSDMPDIETTKILSGYIYNYALITIRDFDDEIIHQFPVIELGYSKDIHGYYLGDPTFE